MRPRTLRSSPTKPRRSSLPSSTSTTKLSFNRRRARPGSRFVVFPPTSFLFSFSPKLTFRCPSPQQLNTQLVNATDKLTRIKESFAEKKEKFSATTAKLRAEWVPLSFFQRVPLPCQLSRAPFPLTGTRRSPSSAMTTTLSSGRPRRRSPDWREWSVALSALSLLAPQVNHLFFCFQTETYVADNQSEANELMDKYWELRDQVGKSASPSHLPLFLLTFAFVDLFFAQRPT
jgi:hypothetical protein